MRMQAAHAAAIASSRGSTYRKTKTNMSVDKIPPRIGMGPGELGVQQAIQEVESYAELPDGSSDKKDNEPLAVTSMMNDLADITADPYG